MAYYVSRFIAIYYMAGANPIFRAVFIIYGHWEASFIISPNNNFDIVM
jgi:hypothetical protein